MCRRANLELGQPARSSPAAPAVPGITGFKNISSVPWNTRFQNLLEFAEACAVPAKWSCRTGVCHNCESALVGGNISYSPDPLDPPAAGNVLICCASPSSDIELDL